MHIWGSLKLLYVSLLHLHTGPHPKAASPSNNTVGYICTTLSPSTGTVFMAPELPLYAVISPLSMVEIMHHTCTCTVHTGTGAYKG